MPAYIQLDHVYGFDGYDLNLTTPSIIIPSRSTIFNEVGTILNKNNKNENCSISDENSTNCTVFSTIPTIKFPMIPSVVCNVLGGGAGVDYIDMKTESDDNTSTKNNHITSIKAVNTIDINNNYHNTNNNDSTNNNYDTNSNNNNIIRIASPVRKSFTGRILSLFPIKRPRFIIQR